ncbi:MAG: holo-ACP synthase [Armatimonadota bacterium]|nr:holo-ACP synthase [Armatimonadota bacterium]MDR7612934.1 holo-ACP synthase [Armatimonadota bacterium]
MVVCGVGVDLVEVRRVERALARWGDAFARRVFTAAELERARAPRARSMRLAARFAAKEAVMKALGLGWRTMGWREIEILHDPLGKPVVALHGHARAAADRQGVAHVLVSLAHTRHLALASAVALAPPTPATPATR